jgi:hypothetical protein
MRSIHLTLILVSVTLMACGKKPDAAWIPAADSARMMGGAQTAMRGM